MAYLASASCFVSTFYLSLKVTQVLRWFYMAWRSKHLDQGISNFLFQTSFDSTLEFAIRNFRFAIRNPKISFSKPGLMLLRVLKIPICAIVANINSSFFLTFLMILCMKYCNRYVKKPKHLFLQIF